MFKILILIYSTSLAWPDCFFSFFSYPTQKGLAMRNCTVHIPPSYVFICWILPTSISGVLLPTAIYTYLKNRTDIPNLQKKLGCKKRISPRKCNLLNNDEQPKEVISKWGQEILFSYKEAFIHHDGFIRSKILYYRNAQSIQVTKWHKGVKS